MRPAAGSPAITNTGTGLRASAEGPADRDSRAWLSRLRATGAERDEALAELHELLLGAARFALSRRAAQVGREGFDDLATQAADDALLAVLHRLDDFRGDSRFTTWAWKFAFFEACVAVRKRGWLSREVPLEQEGWESLRAQTGPDLSVEEAEVLAALRRATDEVLTPHQRSVFVALALNEVPIDVLAERLDTNRGALYKTLHDARRKLRNELEER